MEQQELIAGAEKLLSSPDGLQVDIVYGNSANKWFFQRSLAVATTEGMEDKTIYQFRRDPNVVKLAGGNHYLMNLINTTDYVKQMKAERRFPPPYNTYLKDMHNLGVGPVEDYVYEFIKAKVFRIPRLINGMMESILLWKTVDKPTVVRAIFIKGYPQGNLFIYENRLVFTCPTHTELSGRAIETIFPAMFVKIKPEEALT
jgi:hypothetical protein